MRDGWLREFLRTPSRPTPSTLAAYIRTLFYSWQRLDEILFSWCSFHADAKAPMPVRRRLDDRDEARISVERLRGSGGSISRRSSSYLRVVPYNWTWCDDLHSYLSELKLNQKTGFLPFTRQKPRRLAPLTRRDDRQV